VAWATGFFVVYLLLVRRRSGLLYVAARQVVPVSALFSLTLIADATMLLAFGDAPPNRITVVTYQAGVVLTAVLLLIRVSEWRRRAADVADAVVEVTYGPSGDVRDLLSHALRDPTVEVAFSVAGADRVTSWVDEAGRPVEALSASRETVIPILVEGRPVAEVATKVDFEGFPGLLDAVESAARLAAEHVRLRSDLQRELDLLTASRVRLLAAADEQRAGLAIELERGAGDSLNQIREQLENVARGRDSAVDGAAQRSAERLQSLENDLRSLAAGLGPVALSQGGLVDALHQLAGESGCDVTVAVNGPCDHVSPVVARTIYYACAEAIANAVKHAAATRVDVEFGATDSCWLLGIVDDGCGGAGVSSGSGLQNVADRVSALGGQFRLESPVGSGTRLTVELPRW
jgi:signal transduction histidine kinase